MNIQAEKRFLADSLKANFGKMSQSYLRVESILATNSQVIFDPTVTGNKSNIASQKLLEQNDQFIVTHISFGLKKTTADTAAAHAVAILHTFVNRTVFDGSAGDANLQAIYNGYLEIVYNDTIQVPSLDMRSFERVPVSQQGTTSAAITGPTTYTIGRSGFDNGLYGYYPIDPFIIAGDQKSRFTINLPTSVALTESSEFNVAVLLLKGYLLQA